MQNRESTWCATNDAVRRPIDDSDAEPAGREHVELLGVACVRTNSSRSLMRWSPAPSRGRALSRPTLHPLVLEACADRQPSVPRASWKKVHASVYSPRWMPNVSPPAARDGRLVRAALGLTTTIVLGLSNALHRRGLRPALRSARPRAGEIAPNVRAADATRPAVPAGCRISGAGGEQVTELLGRDVASDAAARVVGGALRGRSRERLRRGSGVPGNLRGWLTAPAFDGRLDWRLARL